MSQDDEYTQVDLRDDNRCYTVWVPRKFGHIGRVLRVDSHPGRWVVSAVYATKTRTFLDNQRGAWSCFDDVLDGH